MSQTKRKIIITGTHLTPAQELIRQLQQDKNNLWEIHYIGRFSNSNDPNQTAIESKIIPSLGVKFYPISCGKLDRRYLPNTILGIPKTIKGFFQSLTLIKKIKPDITVSFGGYVSVPVIISSRLFKVTAITHEQTLTNSLTTKINAFFVKKIALSFDNPKQTEQLPQNKISITGNLLRSQLFSKTSINQTIKIKNPKLPIIYITAGNQGSHLINTTIKKLLPSLKNFNIIHQTGDNDYSQFKPLTKKYQNYYPSNYFNTQQYAAIIQHANIFISRSGANTSQEIVAFNKKSILIPLLVSQQNEQYLNASWVKKKLPKKTIIIKQENLTPNLLSNSIATLLKINKPTTSFNHQPNMKLLQLINEII